MTGDIRYPRFHFFFEASGESRSVKSVRPGERFDVMSIFRAVPCQLRQNQVIDFQNVQVQFAEFGKSQGQKTLLVVLGEIKDSCELQISLMPVI
jgi:hypothetical protein